VFLGWLRCFIQQDTPFLLFPPYTRNEHSSLGSGESHVLSWGIRHPGYEAILDDRAARKAANILQIPVRGTLSIIVLAKQEGRVSSARAEVKKLIESGFRIGVDVFLKVLKLAGE
jgi:predicted nucleic acid-binding protein